MDCEAFETSPVGSLVPISGHDHYFQRDYNHFAFVPTPLPASLPLVERTYKLITEADRAVGRLDAAAARLPNPSLLVRPAIYREAVSTSALEGTYAPLVDVLEAEYMDERHISYEVREIRNYVRAAARGLDLIKDKPICLTLLAELQAILVQGTRGDGPDAGQLRTRQVYIGEQSEGVENARFVPPPHGDVLVEGFSDWEKWINAEDDIPLLIKAAVGHYQFETLHPFRDGNGRLGRLIILLQLVYDGALHYPLLNLSPYIEVRKEPYKDLLLACSRTGDFNPWVQFFAEAVKAQVASEIARIDELIEIRTDMIETLRRVRAKGVVLDIVEDLIGYPIITVSEAASLHRVTYPPANAAIRRLVDLGILREMTGKSYGRVYACEAVMRAVERPYA
jgi:Fic family protein